MSRRKSSVKASEAIIKNNIQVQDKTGECLSNAKHAKYAKQDNNRETRGEFARDFAGL